MLNSPFPGIRLLVVYASHFISPGSIRDPRQGRPTHSALVPEKGSQRQRKANVLAFSRRGTGKKGSDDARNWGTLTRSQIRVEVHEGEGQGSGKHRRNVEASVQRPGVAFNQEKKIPSRIQRSPPVKLFPLLPEPEGPPATTRQESQWPKGSHFRLSTATGTYVMTRRRASSGCGKQGARLCAGNWRANTSTAHALDSWAGRKWPEVVLGTGRGRGLAGAW